MKEKHVDESKTTMTQTVFPNDVNNAGTLYGGRLLDWIDTLGGIVAKRHSRSDIVTASIDSLSCNHKPTFISVTSICNYAPKNLFIWIKDIINRFYHKTHFF